MHLSALRSYHIFRRVWLFVVVFDVVLKVHNLSLVPFSPRASSSLLTLGCSYHLMAVQFILDVMVQCSSWPTRLSSRLAQQHLLAAVLCNNRRWGGGVPVVFSSGHLLCVARVSLSTSSPPLFVPPTPPLLSLSLFSVSRQHCVFILISSSSLFPSTSFRRHFYFPFPHPFLSSLLYSTFISYCFFIIALSMVLYLPTHHFFSYPLIQFCTYFAVFMLPLGHTGLIPKKLYEQ